MNAKEKYLNKLAARELEYAAIKEEIQLEALIKKELKIAANIKNKIPKSIEVISAQRERKRAYDRIRQSKIHKNIKNNKEKYEQLKEKDRIRAAKKRADNKDIVNAYNRENYKLICDRVKARVLAYKDKSRTERVINRVLKHLDAGSIGTGQFSDSINEAVELCIAEFNKSSKRTDSE